MNSSLYLHANLVQTREDADRLVQRCVEDLRTMKGPIVPLSEQEADRIARKNLVMQAVMDSPEGKERWVTLFGCAYPLDRAIVSPSDMKNNPIGVADRIRAEGSVTVVSPVTGRKWEISLLDDE